MSQNNTYKYLRKINIILLSIFLNLTSITHASDGGISSGGGNAVGKILFDFYENAKTEKIPINQLNTWRENLGNILLKLEQEIPSVNGKNLREHLVENANKKNWLLDPKPLKQEGDCLNSSMIKAKQTIIACQNQRYVRISLKWFLDVDEKNANGVILHEMYLAFVMSQSEKLLLDKDTRDEIVRDLNRATFDNNFEEIIKILKNDLHLTVLNKSQFLESEKQTEQLNQAKQLIKESEAKRKEQFCNGENILLTPDEKEAYKLLDKNDISASKFRLLYTEYFQRILNQIDVESGFEINDYCLISDVKSKRFSSNVNLIPEYCSKAIPQLSNKLLAKINNGSEASDVLTELSISAIECAQEAQRINGYKKSYSSSYPFSQVLRNIKLSILETPEFQPYLNFLDEEE